MNAMQKVAWTEVIVSVAAAATVTVMYPWLGHAAISGFSLLALIALSALFLRQRGNSVVVDERDQKIERHAKNIGVAAAWMTTSTFLIVATMWAGYSQTNAVSSLLLEWLIWIQFAICYGVKGLAGVILYQRPQHAA